MSSSVREKTVEQIRSAKRAAKEVGNAVEKGIKSASDKLEHIEAKVRGASAETSSGDSPKPSQKVASKKAVKKAPAKKKASKKS
jgi:hypothetical protein